MIRALTLAAAVVAAPTLLFALPQAPPEGGPRRPRDEVFRMVDAYVVSNLQESLSLTDDQFVKILPLVRRLQTNRRAATVRRMTALHELRRAMASGTVTEARAIALLSEVKAAEAEEVEKVRRDRDALDAALTPIQQARFRVMEAEVDHRIRELIGRRGGQRPPAGRQRGGEPPPGN